MIRKIVKIDNEKCNGCGICVTACHEDAIELINGKARLVKDDYCDGLGDCLPTCPTGAITFEEREAAAYDDAAVKARQSAKAQDAPLPCGCPSTHAKTFHRSAQSAPIKQENEVFSSSQLSQFPIQLQLVAPNAAFFNNCHLLIAADCTAFAYGNFHNKFIKNKITLIGCPKLDHADYAEKLTLILQHNDIQSITVTRMEVPCCGGIVQSVKQALINSGKMIPWQVVTISTDGEIVE